MFSRAPTASKLARAAPLPRSTTISRSARGPITFALSPKPTKYRASTSSAAVRNTMFAALGVQVMSAASGATGRFPRAHRATDLSISNSHV